MMTVRSNLTILLIVLLVVGCSRSQYRRGADAETYSIVGEKVQGTTWDLPEFTIAQDPRSRLADPLNPDCPDLPFPQPRLYTYQLPPTCPIRFVAQKEAGQSARDTLRSEGESGLVLTAVEEIVPSEQGSGGGGQGATGQGQSGQRASSTGDTSQMMTAPRAEYLQQSLSRTDSSSGLPLRPVSTLAWEAISPACIAQMLEFQSVRDEYERTYNGEPPTELRNAAQRLTLEEIVELAQLNSREFQTQKERLYLAALALTLQRFDYQLKFSNFGNGTAVDWTHSRTGGTTVDTLRVPTRVQAEKMLATGGDLVARFANDVVLTFNGAKGFSSQVSSELLFRLTQPLIQRDVRLEPLIQAERNVVYAARDFARFRKVFFVQLASDYYALLRLYRQIEIDAQNYFSLVRAFNRAEAEEQAGIQSRMQVEQIEQNMLQGRSRLITTCNAIESSLDRLKIDMGLPTEQPINLDLRELEMLTLRDEVQVAGERVSRARRRLESHRQPAQPDRTQVLNAAIILNDRLIEWLELRGRIESGREDLAALRELHARLRVDDARVTVEVAAQELEKVRTAVPPSETIDVLRRTMDVVQASVRLLYRQHELAMVAGSDPAATARLLEQAKQFEQQVDTLQTHLDAVLKQAELERLEELLRTAENLLDETSKHVKAADAIAAPSEPPSSESDQVLAQADALLNLSAELLQAAGLGLVPVDISTDDAMLTALASRLDLMNERGQVADDRRNIKIAADDLRSIMNLEAEQRIRTEKNRPFAFTFDESETRLNLSLDLPLNRKAQRNVYRATLIEYQAGLRELIEREDQIKLAVRDDLRALAQARGQYLISVAGAALAAERVLSTRLELTLGFPGIAARDFLEAQDAYSRALSAVADNRITHIRERMRLFADLELMLLDPCGYWPELHDERFQPVRLYELPWNAGPPFGDIPPFLKVSDEIRKTAP